VVDQQPVQFARPNPRIPTKCGAGEQLSLSGDLGAGVTRTHDDECAPGGSLDRVAARVRELELGQHVVAQVERLGEGLEPLRPLGRARNREHPRDAAGSEHEPVETDSTPSSLGIEHLHGARADVGGDDVAGHQRRTGQRRTQRHGDVPRVDDPRGDLGQERQVEHVVGG
jgi:hypothetical protein